MRYAHWQRVHDYEQRLNRELDHSENLAQATSEIRRRPTGRRVA